MIIYSALLRGINVGGKNIIRMADLRQFFLDIGCLDVQTYIQSGNVIFKSGNPDRGSLAKTIRQELSQTFDYHNPLVLMCLPDLQKIVSEAPSGFGEEIQSYKYDVLFLLPPLTALEAIQDVPVREDVDRAWKGPGVIYYRRSSEQLTRSMLNKLPSKPLYQKMTIRNWRTTNKILELAGQT
jgi:uncharacterized protein (DUF1697 family)